MNFYEFVHTNFVFVCKTSNLFVRIREGFQHVMLQMACTVCIICGIDAFSLTTLNLSASYVGKHLN